MEARQVRTFSAVVVDAMVVQGNGGMVGDDSLVKMDELSFSEPELLSSLSLSLLLSLGPSVIEIIARLLLDASSIGSPPFKSCSIEIGSSKDDKDVVVVRSQVSRARCL